jgi:phosphate/sulfate permease
VIVASWLGLPVSTTHIAVGAVFGVGFFREWYTRNSKRRIEYMRRKAEVWISTSRTIRIRMRFVAAASCAARIS